MLTLLCQHPRHRQHRDRSATRSVTTASSGDALLKVPDGIGHVNLVSQVASSDDEPTAANTISEVAVSLALLLREVGNVAAGLSVASVAVEHHAGNLALDIVRETPDGSGHDGRALAVTASDDDGVRALAGRKVEEALRLAVRSACGAFGEGVGADAGGVRAADTLARDLVGAVGVFEAFASGRADGGTLVGRIMSGKLQYRELDWGGTGACLRCYRSR